MTPRTRPQARIGPPRDTGLVLNHTRRRRDWRPAATVVVIVIATLGTLGWLGSRAAAPQATPEAPRQARSAGATVEVLSDPTPLFASYRSLRLHLPVAEEAVTTLAFHQASSPVALHMDSLLTEMSVKAVAKSKTTALPAKEATQGADVEAAEYGAPTIYNGGAIRLWRSNRRGAPDTAADIGAKPGTVVLAPVSGTVIAVRAYKLYGKHADTEVHIKPDGWPEVDVVLIHISDVSVKVGDRVEGGITPVARVRRLSQYVTHQLSDYTPDKGDHVHIQLNRMAVPGKIGPVGEY